MNDITRVHACACALSSLDSRAAACAAEDEGLGAHEARIRRLGRNSLRRTGTMLGAVVGAMAAALVAVLMRGGR